MLMSVDLIVDSFSKIVDTMEFSKLNSTNCNKVNYKTVLKLVTKAYQ